MSPILPRQLVWPVCAVLLCACAALERIPPETRSPAERRGEASALTRFGVSGKLGIWSDDQAFNSRFDWRQDAAASRVVLTAPFGFGQWTLTASPETGASLQRGNGEPWRDVSMDRLVQRALRLAAPIPIGQLPYWLRGLASRADTPRYDRYGRLESFAHRASAGTLWQVDILHHDRFEGIEVPVLIAASGRVASGDGDAERYRLRVVLDDWRMLERRSGTAPATGSRRLKIPGR